MWLMAVLQVEYNKIVFSQILRRWSDNDDTLV